jgi:hypothetical protein
MIDQAVLYDDRHDAAKLCDETSLPVMATTVLADVLCCGRYAYASAFRY